MSTETPKPIEAHLTINAEERAALISILERALSETRGRGASDPHPGLPRARAA